MPAEFDIIRVLIVDDHPIVREGVALFMNRQPDLQVVAEAETMAQALNLLDEQAIDLAVVDLVLPGPSGLELIKHIKAEHPQLPVLVLSMHDEAFYAERALRVGAAGYVMKQEDIEEVVHAVRQVWQGEIYVSARMASRMLHRFVKGEPTYDSPVAQLSDRELEVFHLLGQGYGTREIAEMLHLSVKTIESYRANIKDKLDLDNANELMQHAVRWSQSMKWM